MDALLLREFSLCLPEAGIVRVRVFPQDVEYLFSFSLDSWLRRTLNFKVLFPHPTAAP
jgi:hypothetical protein